MATARAGCAISLLVVLFHLTCAQNTYSVPDVTIEVFSPKGFRASIPNEPGMSLFVFQGNVNRNIRSNSIGTLKGEVLQATDDKWVFEDPNVVLKIGDIINYYVFVSVDRAGYLKDNLSYSILKFSTRGDTGSSSKNETMVECLATVTKVRGGRACGGQTIFEENFSNLREDIWRIEQYIPLSHPEYPFVSYQRRLVSVENGFLRIAPKTQQSMPGFTNESIALGILDLTNGCTSRAEDCYREVNGADILPPVASGRITSAYFAFTYGTITVKAKLPYGDWIYPEILLEPILKKYGSSHFQSGVLKIASARGNKELRAGLDKYGNKVLYGGPIMDRQCRAQLLDRKVLMDGELWADQFHDYSLTWTPQHISLSVDGQEWARVEAGLALHERFPAQCTELPRRLLSKGSRIAPFDDFFQITLGVAAGGITEFYDDTYTMNGNPKPWNNMKRKAMLTFWQDQPNWEQTWNNPVLLVDSVKVVAL